MESAPTLTQDESGQNAPPLIGGPDRKPKTPSHGRDQQVFTDGKCVVPMASDINIYRGETLRRGNIHTHDNGDHKTHKTDRYFDGELSGIEELRARTKGFRDVRRLARNYGRKARASKRLAAIAEGNV